MSLSRGSSTLLRPYRACRRVDFFSFSRVWFRHFSLWAFLTHRIHRHYSHFTFIIHWDSLDFTQPTQILSACFPCYRCNFSSTLQSSFLHCIDLSARCFLFLLDLFRGGSTSQCQLARPTHLTTTRALTNGRNFTEGRRRTLCFFITSYMHTQQLDDTYHDFSDIPLYDEYSYRYSHHRIFRASHTKMSWILAMIHPAFLPSDVPPNVSRSKHRHRRIKQSLFRSVEPTSVPYPFSNNNSVYVLLLPIVCVYHTPLSS